jgi:hypothetical protein
MPRPAPVLSATDATEVAEHEKARESRCHEYPGPPCTSSNELQYEHH